MAVRSKSRGNYGRACVRRRLPLLPAGSQLVFLSHDAAVTCGGHNATAAMHRLPWPGGKPAAAAADAAAAAAPVPLIPVVGAAASRGGFPGLYPAGQLARNPWLADGRLVMLSTWGAGEAIIAVDVLSADKGGAERVERLTPAPADGGGQWCASLPPHLLA